MLLLPKKKSFFSSLTSRSRKKKLFFPLLFPIGNFYFSRSVGFAKTATENFFFLVDGVAFNLQRCEIWDIGGCNNDTKKKKEKKKEKKNLNFRLSPSTSLFSLQRRFYGMIFSSPPPPPPPPPPPSFLATDVVSVLLEEGGGGGELRRKFHQPSQPGREKGSQSPLVVRVVVQFKKKKGK